MTTPCVLEPTTGDHVYCRTHHVWDEHDPAELERIAAFVDDRDLDDLPSDEPEDE